MIVAHSKFDDVPTHHISLHNIIRIICDDTYVFRGHVFHEGSVTTIVWASQGEVVFASCEFHRNAIVVVSGRTMRISSGNIFHSDSKIYGSVVHLTCYSPYPIMLDCKEYEIYTDYVGWTDEELDKLGRGKIVKYYHDFEITTIPEEHNARMIARMRADYGFTASRLSNIPSDLKSRRRRAIAHSLIAMVSARDIKRVGGHSALRMLPRYLLMMCKEMLW